MFRWPSPRWYRRFYSKARDKEILALRDSGMTLEAIGEKYGISRQRVHQILKRASRKGQDDPR